MSLLKDHPAFAGISIGSRELDLNASVQSYQDIVCIEAELSGYHRSTLHVSIDFDRRIVAWKDSHQWNNNFLRSISLEKTREIRGMIPATRLLQWTTHMDGPVSQSDAAVCRSADWNVTITFGNRLPVRIIGSGQYPCEWPIFRDMIESITKIPFRLR